MRRQLDTYDGNQVCVGDVVYVRAVVKKVVLSEELEVALLSKTTEYTELVRTDQCELDLPELGEEPPDGSIVMCRGDNEIQYVFRRDEREGHNDRETRRHDRIWWSYVDQAWVDWVYVVRHGGLSGQILTAGAEVARGSVDDEPDPLSGLYTDEAEEREIEQVMRDCVHQGRPFNRIRSMIVKRLSVGNALSYPAAEEHLAWRVARGDMKVVQAVPGGADRWIWIR